MTQSARLGWRIPLIAGALTVLGWATVETAYAETTYQLSVHGSATYTDNVNNAPDKPLPDAPATERKAGMSYGLVPGATISYATPRTTYSLGYHRTQMYAPAADPELSGSDALAGTAKTELSPVDQLNGNLTLTNSSFTGLLFQSGSSGAIDGVQNSGTDRLLRISLGQGWNHDWAETWSSTQSASVATQTNLSAGDTPTNLVLLNALGVTHTFGYNTMGLNASVNSVRSSNAVGADKWQHLLALGSTWSREIYENTTLSLGVGVSHLLGAKFLQANGNVNLRHSIDTTQLALGYSHGQSADLQTGSVFTTDQVSTSANDTPFEALALSGTLNASYSRRQAATGNQQEPVDNVEIGCSVNWSESFATASLRYQHFKQLASHGTIQDLPSLSRNAVTLTIGVAYP